MTMTTTAEVATRGFSLSTLPSRITSILGAAKAKALSLVSWATTKASGLVNRVPSAAVIGTAAVTLSTPRGQRTVARTLGTGLLILAAAANGVVSLATRLVTAPIMMLGKAVGRSRQETGERIQGVATSIRSTVDKGVDFVSGLVGRVVVIGYKALTSKPASLALTGIAGVGIVGLVDVLAFGTTGGLVGWLAQQSVVGGPVAWTVAKGLTLIGSLQLVGIALGGATVIGLVTIAPRIPAMLRKGNTEVGQAFLEMIPQPLAKSFLDKAREANEAEEAAQAVQEAVEATEAAVEATEAALDAVEATVAAEQPAKGSNSRKRGSRSSQAAKKATPTPKAPQNRVAAASSSTKQVTTAKVDPKAEAVANNAGFDKDAVAKTVAEITKGDQHS